MESQRKMTIAEQKMLLILASIKVHYPNLNTPPREGAISWTRHFSDINMELVEIAVNAFIAADEKGFPPVPGQIRAIINTLTKSDSMTEIEAWAHVKKAMRNSSYNSIEEHSKLPLVIQSIVTPAQLKDWAQADIGDDQVIGSNFMRSYRAKAGRVEKFEALPDDAKKMVTGYTGKMLE